MRGHLIAVALLTVSACRCHPLITDVPPAELVVEPSRLVLPTAWVGQTTRATLSLANRGGVTAEGEVSIEPPFATVTKRFSVGRGESQTLVVEFAPLSAGMFTATLLGVGVEVVGEGKQPPACMTSGACHSVHFDFELGQCVETVDSDGTACMTSCVFGACTAGQCLGQLIACDDMDACTVDSCSLSSGCGHTPRQCPPVTMPCKVSVCDPATGCRTEDMTDGALCGPDDCTSNTVDLCILGQCVTRPRPASGKCANRWVVTSPPPRGGVAGAYDAQRGHMVIFGGSDGLPRDDTWELYGTRWVQRFPVSSPPARSHHAMAYDAARGRIVLFGGQDATNKLGDTWEWDGTNWLQRAPPVSPQARMYHAMTYDSARRRVLLFGGYTETAMPQDTWGWNGLTWTRLMPATVPMPPRQITAMAYDEARQRAVLHGGIEAGSATTWEWDGTNWQRRTATLPARYTLSTMVYDPVRRRIVLFAADLAARDVWEYDGATWIQIPQPMPAAPPRYFEVAAFEPALQRIVVFGGAWGPYLGDTWSWNGSAWSQVTLPIPEMRIEHAVAYDSARERVVLFGGWYTKELGDTWEWDGSTWSLKAPPVSPTPRMGHAMAYDAARERVLMVGGAFLDAGLTAETWEWDGATWTQRSPPVSPPARTEGALAYDAARQRVVLYGGEGAPPHLDDTWEWDGTTWLDRTVPDAGPHGRSHHTLVYDGARQRVQLFAGAAPPSADCRDDLWEWNGSAWVDVTPAVRPPERSFHGAAYDVDRARTIVFGGWPCSGGYLTDTWELDGTAWLQRMPLTVPPQLPSPRLTYDAARKRVMFFAQTDTWLFLP